MFMTLYLDKSVIYRDRTRILPNSNGVKTLKEMCSITGQVPSDACGTNQIKAQFFVATFDKG